MMTKAKWFLMSKYRKLKYTLDVCYTNKQRFHFAGFVFDFDKMVIEKEQIDGKA